MIGFFQKKVKGKSKEKHKGYLVILEENERKTKGNIKENDKIFLKFFHS